MRSVRLIAAALAVACASVTAGAAATPTPRYPDYGYLPPPGQYSGRTFKLSQDYPVVRPPLDLPTRRILSIDFTRDWRAYAEAVRAYAFAGNIHGGPVGQDFHFEDNPIRRWYNVPWEHVGPAGREGIHGLTTEGAVAPPYLSPSQTQTHQSYALGFQNNQGGWLIGQVWNDRAHPHPERVGSYGFPVGTVITKLLFTTASPAEAPYLTNPLSWNAYAYDGIVELGQRVLPKRTVQQVNLIQVDFMVRDDRARTTGGWVFGTFVYNGALARQRLWDNLVPVGISWGSDPTVTSMSAENPAPATTIANPDLKHTAINVGDRALPPQHLGFGLRLSGPVDNAQSSCQSCHQTAEFPLTLAFTPQDASGKPYAPASPEWMRWFRDKPPRVPFTSGALSMDNSMEMTIAAFNYVNTSGTRAGALFDRQVKIGPPPHPPTGQRGIRPGGAAHGSTTP